MEDKVFFLQGNEACARGAIAAGCTFYAGYPITPATEIAEELSHLLPEHKGNFIQMEDELACMGAVVGASLAGGKSMTATSGPGFTLMQENIGYAAMVEAPCVIVDVMRGGPSTGLPTLPSQGDVMQTRWGTHGDHPIIVLAPSSVSDMYYMTIDAFNLSERFRVPVIMASDAIIGHMREKIAISDLSTLKIVNRKKPESFDNYLPYRADADGVPPMANMGDGYRHYITGCMHDESGAAKMMFPNITAGLNQRFIDKIELNRKDIVRTEERYTDGADVIVVAYGSVWRTALAAVESARAEGLNVGCFRPITLWPSPEKEFIEAARSAKTVIVAEMNCGQYAAEIGNIIGKNALKCKIVSIGQMNGELVRPNLIKEYIERECK